MNIINEIQQLVENSIDNLMLIHRNDALFRLVEPVFVLNSEISKEAQMLFKASTKSDTDHLLFKSDSNINESLRKIKPAQNTLSPQEVDEFSYVVDSINN